MIITVNVTQDCIYSGEAANCERCPVALAMLHAGLINPVAGYDTLNWQGREISTPPAVQKFIERFDDHDDVEPFSFVIDTDKAMETL